MRLLLVTHLTRKVRSSCNAVRMSTRAMDVTSRAKPSPPRVDAADVLFLIVKHLRFCGLSASAMALLRESDVDTAWFCGPSREMRLLREWVFAGDFARAKTLLQPLAGALTHEELSDAMAVIEKQQLLESFYQSGESTPKRRQAILDELRTRRQELRVDESELSQCMRALVGGASHSPKSTVIALKDQVPSHPAGQWDVNEARMQCFERLVPFFRGDIDPEDDEHKYLAVMPTQLMALVQDGVTYNSKRAVSSGEMAHWDCISVVSESHHVARDQLHDVSSQHLFLMEKQLPANLRARVASLPLLSRSVDWSRLQGNWTYAAAATDPKELLVKPESSGSGKRRNPLGMSLDFDKARLAKQRQHQHTRANELIMEEADEDDSESDEGETPASSSSPSVKNASKAAPVVKVLCDSATQTTTMLHQVPTFALGEPLTANGIRKPEVHEKAEAFFTPVVIDKSARNPSDQAPESLEPDVPEPLVGDLKHGVRVNLAQSGLHGSLNMRVPGSDPLAMSFTSDASRSVCIDDDNDDENEDDDDQLVLSTVPENKSPISKYLEEENENEEEDQDQQDQNPEAGDIDGGSQEEELQDRRPERYDQLAVDHIMRASVVAEVKEAHAVRAIDLNSSGSQLAIGTNARALRVFDLIAPLASALLPDSSMIRTTSTTSSRSNFTTPQHSFLPLLPVLVERHKHHQTSIYCVAYNNSNSSTSSSSGVIASGDADSSIKVLSLATNKELLIQSHRGKIRALHFATDNRLWSTATGDLRIRCWDLSRSPVDSSSASSCMDLDGHVGEIQALTFAQASSHHHHLLSASLDKTIRLWDHRSGKCERIVASRLASPAFTLQLNPTDDSRYFASGHQDGSVALWDLRMKGKPLQSLAHHQDECRALSWSPDGVWLLSSSFDGTICIMQASGTADTTLAPMASYHQHQDKVLQAQWHPTQPAVVTTGADKLVKLWAFA